MLNIRIEKADKGFVLKIGSQSFALTALEIWALRRVLDATDKEMYEEIEGALNPDRSD